MAANEKSNFMPNNKSPSNLEGRRAGTICPWCKSRECLIKDEIFSCPRCGYEVNIGGPHEIQVIGWTTNKDIDLLCCDCKTSAIYAAIVKAIKKKGYSFSWLEHRSEILPCVPVINNGYCIYCGPRTWAAIMVEAHGVKDSCSEAYAEYAFGPVAHPIYPRKSVNYDLIIPFEIETQ